MRRGSNRVLFHRVMSDPKPQRTKRDRAALRQQATTRRHWTALGWVALVLSLLTFWLLLPLWTPLLLAAWFAHIAWPIYQKLYKALHQRERAAAVLTVSLAVAVLSPLVIAGLSLSTSALELGHKLLESQSGREALKALVGNGGARVNFREFGFQQWLELARQHGVQAWGAANTLLTLATKLFVGLVLFVAAFYVFLVQGKQLYAWLLDRSPLSRGHSHRLAEAFSETGHGLIVGVGLTSLIQGGIATVGYFVTGVPSALVLGLATAIASLVPSVGSGLVWVPVTAGLALGGRTGAAVVLLMIGCVVCTIDNVLRPLLMQYGNLRLHALLLFVAMLGGMAAFGSAGLLVGPLILRLATEGLSMLKEHRAEEASSI
jgi:predicted PurR-regulated permease PerM